MQRNVHTAVPDRRLVPALAQQCSSSTYGQGCILATIEARPTAHLGLVGLGLQGDGVAVEHGAQVVAGAVEFWAQPDGAPELGGSGGSQEGALPRRPQRCQLLQHQAQVVQRLHKCRQRSNLSHGFFLVAHALFGLVAHVLSVVAWRLRGRHDLHSPLLTGSNSSRHQAVSPLDVPCLCRRLCHLPSNGHIHMAIPTCGLLGFHLSEWLYFSALRSRKSCAAATSERARLWRARSESATPQLYSAAWLLPRSAHAASYLSHACEVPCPDQAHVLLL